MTCETIESWENGSRKHYGTPNQLFVKPVVRVNGGFDTIPDGHKLPLCFMERAELYQSVPAVVNINTTALTVPIELQIPAGAVKGGERLTSALAFNAAAQAGSTDTAILAIRVTNADGTVIAGNINLMTITFPTSAPARAYTAHLDMYYDGTAGTLRVLAQTRNDATYATTPFGAIPFNPANATRIQLTLQHSSVAQGELFQVSFATIGRVN